MTGIKLDAMAPVLPEQSRVNRAIRGTGHIYFWQSGSLWIGKGHGLSQWHAHHAHQLALALEGTFRFRSEKNGPWTQFDAAFVPSRHPHEFALEGIRVAHLFVEPESANGRALSQRYGVSAISALPATKARESAALLLDALQGHADAQTMRAAGRQALASLADADGTLIAGRLLDPRVARALEYIRLRVHAPVSLADAAAAATLSPSRFRHLFVEETGTSFRSYLLWLRINVAIEAAMEGATWTNAAHEAGFADSAHLSRTHKRMFGIEPTAIRRA